MTIFGTGEYSYRPSKLSARVTLPSSLSSSSTCCTSRLPSSAAKYRTPLSRYDRSHSTPLRSMRSESPGYVYNRAVSELDIPHLYRNYSSRTSSSILKDHSELSLKPSHPLCEQSTTTVKMKSPIPRIRKLSSSVASSNRLSYPMSSKIPKDHMARYSQRITEIFENDEEGKDDEKSSSKPFSKFTATQHRAFSVFVPTSSYKSVMEDAKIIEAKYKKMNDDVENNRPKTDLDHLRPKTDNFHPLTQFEPLSRGSSCVTQSPNKSSLMPSSVPTRQTLSEHTIQLFRDAATPSPLIRTVSKNPTMINPTRYLAANLRTAIYNRSSIPPDQDPTPIVYKMPPQLPPPDPSPALPCGLRRRYTNRETRLARQTLEYIKKGERWTSTVERPFVIGI